MKSALGLKIPLENPSDALHRRQRFHVSSLIYFRMRTSTLECKYLSEIPEMSAK
jgi:hypothetical protein